MKTKSIKTKIKEIAKEALIDPTDAFFEKVEEELEKQITVDFLEKIRNEMLKRPSRGRPSKTSGEDHGNI
jgi:hypothetical protein